jgi:hypothetical protein
MMSSKIHNPKIRGKKFDISERDSDLISGALSLIWIKTKQKVESCYFEGDVVKIIYSKNEGRGYFNLYESIDQIDSLLSDFTVMKYYLKFYFYLLFKVKINFFFVLFLFLASSTETRGIGGY